MTSMDVRMASRQTRIFWKGDDMKVSRRLLAGLSIVLLMLLQGRIAHAAPGEPRPEGQALCGGAKFDVLLRRGAHPLDNVYQLYGRPEGGAERQLLYTADDGGWFYAACVQGQKGPVLLFQSYCGGSACVEDKFGIVDARSMKVLLRPGKANVSNEPQAKALLGRDVPSLADDKASFCCDSGQAR